MMNMPVVKQWKKCVVPGCNAKINATIRNRVCPKHFHFQDYCNCRKCFNERKAAERAAAAAKAEKVYREPWSPTLPWEQ